MQRKDKWRLAASIAPPVVLVSLAVTVACSDVMQPTVAAPDEWAEATIEQMQVATELRMLDGSGRLAPVASGSRTVSLSSVSREVPAYSQSSPALLAKPVVRLKHHQVSDSSFVTLAFVHESPSGIPKRIYGFRNGQIQFVYSARYKQRGKHWIKDKVRVTLFKDGAPAAQVDQQLIGASSSPNRLAPAPADASIVESELVGEQTESGACGREFRDAFEKYLLWVGSLGLAAYKLGACGVFGVVSPDCAATMTALAGGSLVAFNAYVDSMQVLTDCEWREWLQRDNATGGSDPISVAPKSGLADAWIDAAYAFIAEAEAAGLSQCNEEGTYCVYYSAEKV